MSDRSRSITDEIIAKAIRACSGDGHLDELITPMDLGELLDELLRLRRAARGDSRRAEQLRKLRWNVEAMLVKLEKIEREIAGENLDTIAASEGNAA